MSAPKHTPGPWAIAEYGGEIVAVGEARIASLSPRDAEESQWEANARLIAAAPDLLAALQSAVLFWDAYRIDETAQIRTARAAAQAAIAKATGEAA